MGLNKINNSKQPQAYAQKNSILWLWQYSSLDRCGRIYFAIHKSPSGTTHAHALTHTHLGAAHEKQIQMEMRANTHRIKAPGCAPTHTNSTKHVWWETPVAVWLCRCQLWANRGRLLTRQIYGCYSSSAYVYVCEHVRGSLLGLPLAKPSLLHLLFLRTPSLSLSVDGLMRSPTSLILPEFLTE